MTASITMHGAEIARNKGVQSPAAMVYGALATLLLAALLVMPIPAAHADALNLDQVRKTVIADYPGVRQISTAGLSKMLAPRGSGRHTPVALFDVREADEFDVSHLQDARQVDPDMWASTFMTRFGEGVKGKAVVFYCSVGVRSSQMAEALQERLKEAGAFQVFNLDGGIFAWHNEQRPLFANADPKPVPTEYVHPYDDKWGKLVERQQLVRYKPAGS